MIDLLITPCRQLVTLRGDNSKPRRKGSLEDLGVIDAGALGVNTQSGLIEYAGGASGVDKSMLAPDCQMVDAAQHCVMPGLVDSHTHLVFAGSRADEFYRRCQGETYQQIAQAGSGIAATMGPTRAATVDELADSARERLDQLINNGTTTVETKSGYGLEPEAELRSLKAIDLLKQSTPALLFSTYLGAHLIPPEFKDRRREYVDIVIAQLQDPEIQGMVDFFDIFVDPLAFTLEESMLIADAGFKAGLKLKLHADEFGDDGTTTWACSIGALSVDHIGGIGEQGINALANSNTVGTLLPATMFFSAHGQYAPARKMVDAGCALALATDLNPGSSLVYSMPFTMTLAALEMGLSAKECIIFSTINAAHSLGAADSIGSLEPGKRADFIVVDIPHYRELAYHVGADLVRDVYLAGNAAKRDGTMLKPA